jgi:hypothetical protein
VSGAACAGAAFGGGAGAGAASSAGGNGTDTHAASIPRIAPVAQSLFMLLILLEALLALAVLLFIVWWTMFAGRKKGEPAREDEPDN